MPTQRAKPPAKTRRTQTDRSAETRQRVMDTAVALIGERSFQAATVFEIAKRAGVTTGAVQHHFPSKAELILSLVDHLGTLPIDSGGIWPAAELPVAERAQAFVHALWRRSYAPDRFLVAWSVYFGCVDDAAVMAHVGERRDAMVARLRQRFGETFPELADARARQVLLDSLLSLLRGLGVGRIFGGDDAAEEAQLRFMAEVLAAQCAGPALKRTLRASPQRGVRPRASGARRKSKSTP